MANKNVFGESTAQSRVPAADTVSFEQFWADMGPRPDPSMSIERINNDQNYGPGNCKWATDAEQSRNQRRNKRITYKGETMILADWAVRLGIKVSTLQMRFWRYGMSVEEAFETPVKGKKKT